MALKLAVDFVEVDGTLYGWICRLQLKEISYPLIVANKNHRIKRIFEVLCHEFLLDIGATFVDEVERNFL